MANDNYDLEIEAEIRENLKQQTGEWSICTFLVFLSAVLVLLLCHLYEVPAKGRIEQLDLTTTLTTIFTFETNADFSVDIAVVILLISIMSSFCGLISLVADKNNTKTWLMRSLTLGPLLPIFFSVVMIMLIASNYNDKSIIQDIIGTTDTIEINVSAD
ncbi:MAG: hypothetical protein CMJ76_09320 [Planctomycetaceae bacterium]|nr:hypothetical protein [Planctomycetaceae bacterium]